MKIIGAAICAALALVSTGAWAVCDESFRYAAYDVCGPSFSISISSAENAKTADIDLLFVETSQEPGASAASPLSIRNAFYPRSGPADIGGRLSDLRDFRLRLENYMASLILPMSSLSEQYEAIKLMIDERRKTGASNDAPGAFP